MFWYFTLLFADTREALGKASESDTEENASDNASLFIPSGSSDDDDACSHNDIEKGEAELDNSNYYYYYCGCVDLTLILIIIMILL